MTRLYFVRHAQPEHSWEVDRTRPLTQEGARDCAQICAALKAVQLDYAVSSPYLRSMETVRQCAAEHGLPLETDERLRERGSGSGGNVTGMFQKRWADFTFCEEGGECLHSVQERNREAVHALLREHAGQSILIGTHGTALSTILNAYDASFLCEGFLRIIDFMPYIIRLDFDGLEYVGREELLIVKKEFKGSARADK